MGVGEEAVLSADMDEVTNLEAECHVAREAAERAGEIIRSYWGRSFEVHKKGEVDLVSEVDIAAEHIIVETLGTRFSRDAIVGEEGVGGDGLVASRTWLVDPLDGTTNFSHGVPHFCVSVALVDEDGPRVGVIHEPLRQWSFYARRGGGAWMNGKRLTVSATPDLAHSVIATGFPYNKWNHPDNNSQRFAHLLRKTQGLRRMGAAALDLCYVAAGWFDGFWEFRLKPWDIAAGLLLVAEAGGQVSDFKGQTCDLWQGEVVATNGRFHVELTDALLAAVAAEESD